jgi:hypothetical protein
MKKANEPVKVRLIVKKITFVPVCKYVELNFCNELSLLYTKEGESNLTTTKAVRS